MMKSGQMSITSLIYGAILVVVFVALLPVLNEVIQDAVDNGHATGTTGLMVLIIPLIFALVIITSIVFYSRPQYPQHPGM